MSFMKLGALALATLTLALALPAAARDQLQIAGSSTVLPFATVVAESFGEQGAFPTPVVEGGGTGAGLKKFCEGVGEGTIDIANASRKINVKEKAACRANGVNSILEVRFGYDGIVFASDAAGPNFAFTPSQLYKALAAQVVINGELVANPFTNWAEIDASLPNQPILALVPGTKHGTREVFEQKVMQKGCAMFGSDKVIKAKLGKDSKACVELRQDGRVVEIDGDYSETLARMKADVHAIGVFGLSFYENNADTLKVATYQGVTPDIATIASGEYGISRPLFMYVKADHIGLIPGLREYVSFFLSEDIAGADGTLAEIGLVPDPKVGEVRSNFDAGKLLN